MPGGFVPYHHSTGKPYKKKSTTSSVSSGVSSFSSGVSKGASKVYGGSPSSYGYVPPTSTSSSSSSSAAAAQAVAQAQAAVKAAKAVVSEYGKDKKNPKSVSGKYAKATERAKKKREKTKAKVQAQTKAVQKKYTTSKAKQIPYPKKGPSGAFEGIAAVNQVLRQVDPKGKAKIDTGVRQKPSTRPTGPKPRKVANRLERAVSKQGVTNPSLGPDQTAFVNELARRTGLSPGVLAGMAASEQPADSPSVPGSQNWLNIGYFDSGPGAPTQDKRFFSTPERAAKTTANFLKGKTLGASEGIQNILSTAGKSEAKQIAAIQNSGWASSGHPNLPELAAQSSPTKTVPKPLKRTARQTLGKQPTKAILQGGKVIKDKNAGEEESGAPSYKETKQYIVPTEARSEIRAEQRAPAKTMVTGMDPALQSALVQLAKNTGIPVRINEGYRTEARANDFASGTASQHHQGNAADIDNNADYSAEDLAKVGLNNTAVGGEPWHFQLNNPDATASTVNTNIPIKGTNLAVQMPAPSASGTTGTTTSGGTTSTGAPVPGTPEYQQMMNEVRRRRGPSVSKRLAAIDRWMTSPVTAPTPEISQELIDRILGK